MLGETRSTTQSRGLFGRFAVAAVVMLALIGLSLPAAAQSLKIGYVDLQRALNQVEEGKKAKKRLKKEFEKKQTQLDKKQKEVKELKKQIEQGGMMMSQEAKRKKALELQKKMADLQQTYLTLQQELSKKEAAATKEIFDKMRGIIQDIAKEKGYDLVLEKTESSVLFAKDGMDLTDELIERYDSQ